MKMPSDYQEGYLRARPRDPVMVSNYIDHTVIGDPDADALMDALNLLAPSEQRRLIQAAMNDVYDPILDDAPSAARDFFHKLAEPPDWYDPDAFAPGVRMFHRNSRLVLAGMVGAVLIEGFTTNISKSFFITGRLRDQGVRRLQQNNRHMVEIFMPGGLERGGDGWNLSVRVRLVHARVRWLLRHSEDWDADAWGVPISAAHLGFAITAFSARLIKHLKALGGIFSEEEAEGFMAVWRYTGHLMGIPDSILFEDTDEALRLFDIGGLCEPPPSEASIAMANGLVNSAPLIIGIADPDERRRLTSYVYKVSRALIGNSVADQLAYPDDSTFGVLYWFRAQTHYGRILDRIVPDRFRNSDFVNFTSLLEASAFEEEGGISYRLPDHVYSEESRDW